MGCVRWAAVVSACQEMTITYTYKQPQGRAACDTSLPSTMEALELH
jgi:hypothetical protein